MLINALHQFVSQTRDSLKKGGNVLKQPPPREKVVAVYGGSNVKEGTPLYDYSKQVGAALADAGFGVLTGGGPGTMKAVAEGAKSKGGYTIGMAMPFIGEDPYDGNDELHFFDDFSSRIDVGYEERSGMTAAVPGGIGTYQEVTKKLVELYTDKTLYPSQKQIVLFELNGFWKKFIDHLKDGPIAAGLMNPKALDLLKVVHSIPEGIAQLKKNIPWTPGLRKLPQSPPQQTASSKNLDIAA